MRFPYETPGTISPYRFTLAWRNYNIDNLNVETEHKAIPGERYRKGNTVPAMNEDHYKSYLSTNGIVGETSPAHTNQRNALPVPDCEFMFASLKTSMPSTYTWKLFSPVRNIGPDNPTSYFSDAGLYLQANDATSTSLTTLPPFTVKSGTVHHEWNWKFQGTLNNDGIRQDPPNSVQFWSYPTPSGTNFSKQAHYFVS